MSDVNSLGQNGSGQGFRSDARSLGRTLSILRKSYTSITQFLNPPVMQKKRCQRQKVAFVSQMSTVGFITSERILNSMSQVYVGFYISFFLFSKVILFCLHQMDLRTNINGYDALVKCSLPDPVHKNRTNDQTQDFSLCMASWSDR